MELPGYSLLLFSHSTEWHGFHWLMRIIAGSFRFRGLNLPRILLHAQCHQLFLILLLGIMKNDDAEIESRRIEAKITLFG